MADYHFAATLVCRSKGQSAVAAAAYRAGVVLEDERLGKTFDYTRRRGVQHTEIRTPASTPDWMRDRGQLWNAIEKAEKRKDSQLARSIDIALPYELSLEQNLELVRSFVDEQYVSRGMIADFAIHAPGRKGDIRNVHVHILLTTREITGSGFGPKQRDWNDKKELLEWRKAWADHANRILEREGFEERIDHRSLLDQGIDREPTTHVGPAGKEMETAAMSPTAPRRTGTSKPRTTIWSFSRRNSPNPTSAWPNSSGSSRPNGWSKSRRPSARRMPSGKKPNSAGASPPRRNALPNRSRQPNSRNLPPQRCAVHLASSSQRPNAWSKSRRSSAQPSRLRSGKATPCPATGNSSVRLHAAGLHPATEPTPGPSYPENSPAARISANGKREPRQAKTILPNQQKLRDDENKSVEDLAKQNADRLARRPRRMRLAQQRLDAQKRESAD